MSESAERVPAGEAHAGEACAWCRAALAAEDEAAICAECATVHHEACWDRELGCGRAGCFNAPLKRLDAAEPQVPVDEAPAPGHRPGLRADEPPSAPGPAPKKKARRKGPTMKRCVGCGAEMAAVVEVCDDCLTVNTPDGLYHGPTRTYQPARDAFVLSLLGLFFCGPILGPMAISRGNKALEPIRKDPRLSGEGLAIAAIVIGVLDLLFWLYAIASNAGRHG